MIEVDLNYTTNVHMITNDRKDKKPIEFTCYKCQQKGHTANVCPQLGNKKVSFKNNGQPVQPILKKTNQNEENKKCNKCGNNNHWTS